jgi:outer membrane protein assembly factor BamB
MKTAAISFLLLTLGAGLVSAQHWPMVNGCREGTSWAEGETVLMPPLDLTKEFSLLGGGTPSGISFHNDVLFVSVDALPSRVVAIHTQTADELWRFEIPNAEFSVELVPAANDSLVLCGGQHGLGLHALDRHTGTEKWFKGMGGLFARHPVIDSNRVYIVGDSLYCLNMGDGSTVWSVPFSGRVYPAVDGENVYVCGENKILALDKHDGDTLWQMINSQNWFSSIAVDGSCVYTYNHDSIQALDKEDHSLKWFYKIPDRTFSYASTNAIAITDSFLCVSVWENPDQKGELYALDKATGEYRWHYTFDTVGVYSPTIANGVVYIVKWQSFTIWGFDLHTGENVFFDDSMRYFNQPIVVNGKLFVGSDRKVVTFENYGTGTRSVREEPKNSPGQIMLWPNPFDESVNLQFALDQPDYLNIIVYNLSGEKVKTITSRKFEAGSHTVSWDGTTEGNRKVTSGIYILKLSTRHQISSRRMILFR